MRLYHILMIIIVISSYSFGYGYPNQREIDTLTREIYVSQEQHRLLYEQYLVEKSKRFNTKRVNAYVKALNKSRARGIELIKSRNRLILDKREHISTQERQRAATYAVEDSGPTVDQIVKMKGKMLVNIDLSSQRMTLHKGGKLLYSWQVSTARNGYTTPIGRYKAYHLERMHYSKLYDNSPMPYSVFFKHGYAIHGTHYVRGLGRRASHGCVRLRTSNARKLYNIIKRSGYNNTTIKIRA